MRRLSILLVIVVLGAGMVACAEPVQYTLNISSTEGGEITTPGEETSSYEEGTEVPLVALPHTGYRFVDWTGDVDSVEDVSAASTTVTMNGDYSMTASFAKQYELTISSTAGGSVTVPGEATYAYDEGKVVNLVAQAEDGYHFVDWTGSVSTIADAGDSTTIITVDGDYIVTANFAVAPYFQVDAWLVLYAPATLPPEGRDPWVGLCVMTNIVVDSVRVDLPNSGSVIVPPHTGVFTPDVDQITELRFCTGVGGMPVVGEEYTFTGLDETGEPIPGARNTDVWVGVEAPDPPANVRPEVVEDGILVSWDESAIIPGSFEPAAENQLGYYQLWISRDETGEWVYGATGLSGSPYVVPRDRAGFVEGKDFGLSLSEMGDGAYSLGVCVLSFAPEDSLGEGFEYDSSDPGENIIFTIQDGEITIE